MASGVVRDVVERNSRSEPAAPSIRSLGGSDGPTKTGFPVAQHRSKMKSAFRQARLDERAQSGLIESRKQVTSTDTSPREVTSIDSKSLKTIRPPEDWMTEVSHMNEKLVTEMSADERARHKNDLIDEFNPGIEDLMAKVREARERRAASHASAGTQLAAGSTTDPTITRLPSSTPPPHIHATRKIRFAEPTEADVHVYESQPSSPKRVLALLQAPDDTEGRADISSLGTFKGTIKAQDSLGPVIASGGHPGIDSVEEGTPEDIRRRFFPSEPAPNANPALLWMLPGSSTSSIEPLPSDRAESLECKSHFGPSQAPRYSLSGARLSPTDIINLPTHLGLHHHGSSSPSSDVPAGYTLSDLLLLSRSSVYAQRASILGVLAKVLRNAREQRILRLSPEGASQTNQGATRSSDDVDLDAMRRDMLDSAIDALSEKGGLGQLGVELLWEATVGFSQLDYGVMDLKYLANVDVTPKKFPPPSSLPTEESPIYTISGARLPAVDIIMSLPSGILLPRLRQHLVTSPSVFSRTHSQILDILLLMSHLETHARTIVHSDAGQTVIWAMMQPHICSSFSPAETEMKDMYATPTSILILQTLARSSRDNALKLAGPADVLLRYLVETRPLFTTPQTSIPEHLAFRFSVALLEETLRFYDILLQYGIYSQVATLAQDHIVHLKVWLLESLRVTMDQSLVSLLGAYVSLLARLIVCSTDPHQTMPSHDILWSQVQGWDWGGCIIGIVEFFDTLTDKSCPPSSPMDITLLCVWANIMHALAAWIEGASVNGVKGGEAERLNALSVLQPLFETGRGAWKAVNFAVSTLQAWEISSPLDVLAARYLEQAGRLLGAVVRLELAFSQPGEMEKPFRLPDEDIQTICMRLASHIFSQGPFDFILACHRPGLMSESAHIFLKPLGSLMVYQLKFWHQRISTKTVAGRDDHAEDGAWTTQAICVLHILLPGEEDFTQWIVGSICETLLPEVVDTIIPSTDPPRELWEKGGLKILLPFLRSSLQPAPPTSEPNYLNSAISVAPYSPTPKSISRCTTLNIPSFSRMKASWDFEELDTVLPLRKDWPMLPLNHLLRSGTSPAFSALPVGWDASETDIVRASLLLALAVQEIMRRFDIDKSLGMSSAQAIFACMKIFMLEHEQQHVDSGEEVFRDTFVTRWMEDLLKPFTYAQSRNISLTSRDNVPSPPLEQVSKTFLASSTPFYQFYADFLALYDAISFSHPVFARLLLPPVSMRYPPDYRKLLFGDFGHVLRTVKTDVPNLLCGDVREYLWPVERDPHLIGSYLNILLASKVQGFVRWIAIHHVAGNLWPEFSTTELTDGGRARKLMGALLRQSNPETLKDVALYRQREVEVWTPPNCFISDEVEWKRVRLDWAYDIGGELAREKLESLLITM